MIDIVGLSQGLIGEHTPHLREWLADATLLPITPVLPAVTTTAQTTYITGKPPSEHGIVGNGWYSREDAEIKFWKQSNRLVQADKVWDEARRLDPSGQFTVAKSFWWYNMYSSADWSITPRPMYPADGRKLPDIYTTPVELRDYLQRRLGQFPLFNFWGPQADIVCSRWIADAAKIIEEDHAPTLHLIYLPHLDYALQKRGSATVDALSTELREIDEVAHELITFLEARDIRVLLLSEYGISPVDTPVYINRALREAGLITVRVELGRELLDAGACKAFAVADHQIAHVYVNDATHYSAVLQTLRGLDGVDLILDDDGKRSHSIDHPRSGDIVCVAKPNAWFVYYYWLDDEKAPDFARCVDIHRKPGYDPVELFIDPEIPFPTLKAALRLAQKELGFRYLMDLIPLDATLPKGSHGHLTKDLSKGAMFATKQQHLVEEKDVVKATEVRHLILQHLGLQ